MSIQQQSRRRRTVARIGVALAAACLGGAALGASGAWALGELTQFGTPPGSCVSATGTGGLCTAGLGAGLADGPADVAVTADGKSAYVVSAASNSISILSRTATTSKLRYVGCLSRTGVGCGVSGGYGFDDPSAVAISPNGKSVYVASRGSDAIVTFTRNTTTGQLTLAGCFKAVPIGGCLAAKGLDGASDVAVSPDAKSVFVTGRTDNALAIFSRNTTTGALTQTDCLVPVATAACTHVARGLYGAGDVAVSADNKSVIVKGAEEIATLRRNTSTLAITQPAGAAGCIGGFGDDGCGDPTTLLWDRFVVTPDGKAVYATAASFGGTHLVTYKRDTTTGALTRLGIDATPGADAIAVSKDNKTVYVSQAQTNPIDLRYSTGVVAYARNATTQALTPVVSKGIFLGCVSSDGYCSDGVAIASPSAIAVSADNKSVYITSPNDDAVGAFVRSTVAPVGAIHQIDQPAPACISDDGSGKLCTLGKGLSGATGVAITKDGKSVYVASAFSDALAGFTRTSTTGLLSEFGCVAASDPDCAPYDADPALAAGTSSVAIAPDGKKVYVGAGNGAAVSVYTRDTTGHVFRSGCVNDFFPVGDCESSDGLDSPAAIAVSPNSKNVYVVSSGSGSLATLTVGEVVGPTECFAHSAGSSFNSCLPISGLAGARGVAVSPDAKSVYVVGADTDSSTLNVFSRNTTTGRLTPKGCFSDTDVSCVHAKALTGAAAVTVSADNKTVYVAAADGGVAGFSRNATTGALTQIACRSSSGDGPCDHSRGIDEPTSIVVSKDNKSVYVGNTDGSIGVFHRTTSGAATGVLTQDHAITACIAPAATDGCTPGVEMGAITGLTVSQDNKHVYAVSPATGAILSFTRKTTTTQGVDAS